jgi:hypothetical protein
MAAVLCGNIILAGPLCNGQPAESISRKLKSKYVINGENNGAHQRNVMAKIMSIWRNVAAYLSGSAGVIGQWRS